MKIESNHMVEETSSPIVEKIEAKEARKRSEENQKGNLDLVFKLINGAIHCGKVSCVVFEGLSFNQIQELMTLGYSIRKNVDPMGYENLVISW